MSLTGCLSALVVLVFLMTAPPGAGAAPLTCREIQSHMDGLKLTIRKAAGKEAAARARAELDRLTAQAAQVCAAQGTAEASARKGPAKSKKAVSEGVTKAKVATPKGAAKVKGAAPKGADAGNAGIADQKDVLFPQAVVGQAETPEEESRRRRDMINRLGQPVPGLPRTGAGTVMRAIPLEGMIVIEGATASTLYGKVRQELSYTIRETFVGNLIVSRSRNPGTGRSGSREDYVIQTLSTEIDVERFSGRGCAKYTGSPPVCTQWHRIDLWQIADGEEYPGRADGVVTATSDGRGMILRVDGPVIEFGSSEGPVGIRSGCGGTLRMAVSRDEVGQWLRRQTVRIKRETGKTVPGCRPGSSLTLELRIGPDA